MSEREKPITRLVVEPEQIKVVGVDNNSVTSVHILSISRHGGHRIAYDCMYDLSQTDTCELYIRGKFTASKVPWPSIMNLRLAEYLRREKGRISWRFQSDPEKKTRAEEVLNLIKVTSDLNLRQLLMIEIETLLVTKFPDEAYSCGDFVFDMNGVPRCEDGFRSEDWTIEPYRTPLRPGQTIGIGNILDGQGFRCSHYAIYIGNGLYLSKPGDSKLVVCGLLEMAETYRSEYIYIFSPKSKKRTSRAT